MNLTKQYHPILGQNLGHTLPVVIWRSLKVKLQPRTLLQALSDVSYIVQSAHMAYGHNSRLPPLEAPVMIAEKRKLFFSFSFSNLRWYHYAKV